MTFWGSLRTATAAVASLLIARLFRLPESYWAPITTIVIAHSSFGAALKVSWQRLAGTALGVTVGAIASVFFGAHAIVFGLGVFLLGLLSALARLEKSGYRFAGIAFAIVLLIPRHTPAWQTGWHRFAEVCIGIVVALVFAVVWPYRE